MLLESMSVGYSGKAINPLNNNNTFNSDFVPNAYLDTRTFHIDVLLGKKDHACGLCMIVFVKR